MNNGKKWMRHEFYQDQYVAVRGHEVKIRVRKTIWVYARPDESYGRAMRQATQTF